MSLRFLPFVLLLAGILHLSLAPAALAEPRLTPAETAIDFGVILQGEKVERTFSFRNEGDVPLKINQVRSSCGCTAALLSADLIAPGESGEVTATFDSTRFRGDIKKTIYLYSNDPKRQVTQLHLQGEVRELVLLDPRRVALGTIPAETTTQATLRLTNQGRTPLTFGEVRSSAQEISGNVIPATLQPGETGKLTLTITPRKGTPRINAYVLIGTDNPLLAELRIPVQIQAVQSK